MELRFWGVRGSYPVPGPGTLAIGGNTTCVSVEHGSSLFVFDAGTGICRLGKYLQAARNRAWHGCIFLSHYHWDHIQGLPFFAPAFDQENRFHIYGEASQGVGPRQVLAGQMEPPCFPIAMESQRAFATFNRITAGSTLNLKSDITVRTMALTHPGGAVGYRIEGPSGSVCIITDHEHAGDEPDAAVIEFARGATVLVHEAPYTPDERCGRMAGWGHSSWRDAALVAAESGVERLYLTHHDPSRNDWDVFSFASKASRIFAQTEAATETTVVDLRDPGFDVAGARRTWERRMQEDEMPAPKGRARHVPGEVA